MTKNFQKALKRICMEREFFLKCLDMNLQSLELNLKSASSSKILKFWIREGFSKNF